MLNEEPEAAGGGVFRGGQRPASEAKLLRAQPDGNVLVTDGPYLEINEHIGGFYILEAANLDEALAWGRKGAVARGYRSRCAKFGDPATTEGRARGRW